MSRTALAFALALAALASAAFVPARLDGEASEQGRAKEPDKVVEIVREKGSLAFRERGRKQVEPVTIVVGETIRWVNKDDRPHALRAVAAGPGKAPAFEVKAIAPGASKDVLFDGKMYRSLGGLPAEDVTLKYRADGRAAPEGEIAFFSAARR
ncbi:cupredoxin domain-containing protein [Paludisphaera soli]|uniref:cupredoxin domain-containing protein n=1 Tax=Paludisphaera soli TaxID=2712865 RepID=UPI0013EADDA8|nr:hypothetical protein [Paludisphaera soli]